MRTLENLLRLVPLLKEKMGRICGSSFVTNVCRIFASNVVGWDTLPLLAKLVWRLLVEFLTLEKPMDRDWDLLSRILSLVLNKIRRTTHLHSALKLVGGRLGCRSMMLSSDNGASWSSKALIPRIIYLKAWSCPSLWCLKFYSPANSPHLIAR